MAEAEFKYQHIIDEVAKMPVIDLVGLIEKMEETFGVSAAQMAVAAAPAGGAAQAEAAPAEEQTEFTVTMTDFGANKVSVIKVVRVLTGLGLKEAKELVEGLPAKIKENASKEDAAQCKQQLEEAGAKVEVK